LRPFYDGQSNFSYNFKPSARGSGIAQVKCYLNGIKIPKIVRFETLIAKIFGVAFAVSGGLVCGKVRINNSYHNIY
jgi:H+/Cl- antiporter ClcA